MKITFADNAKAEIVAFIVDEDGGLPAAATDFDNASGGLLAEAMEGSRFSGKKDQQSLIVMPKGSDTRRVVLIGGGKLDKRDARVLEGLGANLYKSHSGSGFKSIAIHAASAEDAARMAVGAKLAAYRFDDYFTKLKDDQKPTVESVTFIVEDVAAAEKAFEPLNAGAEGTILARTLVNLPPNDLYPAAFADRLKEMSDLGVEVEVLGEEKLAKLGMNAMLGVGQGSVKESQLGIMKWMGGTEGDDPVILIGKGVCFDTGGISLKPGPGMEDMRGDMGGAAAVTGTIRALAERKAKVNVIGLVGLVENMPDGNAIRPGDILKSASGQTIEVQNTDAEGRLVLCDVLWYAQEHFKPKAMVDLATLTGAIVISLGHHHAGLFTASDDLADELSKAGQTEGERVWRLPLGPEYDALLKSKFADMRNIGGRAAGSITAAQFLKRFVKEDVKWAHIDIAGVAWVEGEKAAFDVSWASGFGPRLLDRWIADNYES
ncbi:leucyl aminopeptidase [Hyphomonas pacifica]|uniref:Probable cytosol aminopeptidase n=1 Tax=Hyphomonas pacifica TaxID=1280941 RepID=A0A062TUI0_9PROT|nr:leucyl aminopeptidase [Hyphomonas pacifica]KCZ51641.1 aminopeptidase A [Hyphomonas pacifica]RAN32466.1 aminopeptidase A [Hyphomonas pacifica]RAN34310.1 aminopeptidase A [Hyphomonas pacifica]